MAKDSQKMSVGHITMVACGICGSWCPWSFRLLRLAPERPQRPGHLTVRKVRRDGVFFLHVTYMSRMEKSKRFGFNVSIFVHGKVTFPKVSNDFIPQPVKSRKVDSHFFSQ